MEDSKSVTRVLVSNPGRSRSTERSKYRRNNNMGADAGNIVARWWTTKKEKIGESFKESCQ